MRRPRYELNPKQSLVRSQDWLDKHAQKHARAEFPKVCPECEAAARIADGVAHLRDALSELERLQDE